mgnify:FL=1
MIKRKRVYICDHCGAAGLETEYRRYFDIWKDAPEGWTKLGKEDLCPLCSEIYEKFKQQVMNERKDDAE